MCLYATHTHSHINQTHDDELMKSFFFAGEGEEEIQRELSLLQHWKKKGEGRRRF